MTECREGNSASAASPVDAHATGQPGYPDATLAAARQPNESAPAALSEPPARLFEAAALRESLPSAAASL
jgi:hypothetical protein